MTRLLLLLLLAGCDAAVTEVVLTINQNGLTIPADVDQVHIQVTDPADNSTVVYDQAPVSLCAPTQTGACYHFPMSLTLVPGPSRPRDPVRVEVQGLRAAQVVIDDAALFSFDSGARRKLDLTLDAACLGTDCAMLDQSCGAGGQCAAIALQ